MTDPVAKLEYSVAPGTRRSLWQTSVDAIVPYLLLFILAAISAAAACVAVAGATTERVIGLFGAVLFGLAAIAGAGPPRSPTACAEVPAGSREIERSVS